jgi:hypothetical protein
MKVSPTQSVSPVQESVPSQASGSATGIARQQAGQSTAPAASGAHVLSAQSAVAAQFAGLPLKRKADSPASSSSMPRPQTAAIVRASHIEGLPLELHGHIHDAILQSGTPYESVAAMKAFMATSTTIRNRSIFFGGTGALGTAVKEATVNALKATSEEDTYSMFRLGSEFEHLSPDVQVSLLKKMRESHLGYQSFAMTALEVMSAPNFEREVTYLLGPEHPDKFQAFVTLTDVTHKMTDMQLDQMAQLLRNAHVGPRARARAIDMVRSSKGWSQLNDTQKNLFNELAPAESA